MAHRPALPVLVLFALACGAEPALVDPPATTGDEGADTTGSPLFPDVPPHDVPTAVDVADEPAPAPDLVAGDAGSAPPDVRVSPDLGADAGPAPPFFCEPALVESPYDDSFLAFDPAQPYAGDTSTSVSLARAVTTQISARAAGTSSRITRS